jgi:hypothetical protein
LGAKLPDIPSNFNSKIEIELIKFKNNTEWRKLEKQAGNNYQVFK